VARVEGVDTDHDDKSVARPHGAVGKLVILAQGDVGEAELVGDGGAVREAAEEDAEAVGRLIHSEAGHHRHVSQLERRDVCVADQDGRHLRAHSSRLVEVVVVPVEDHLAPGRSSRLHAFLADGRAPRHGEQPHAEPPLGCVRPPLLLIEVEHD